MTGRPALSRPDGWLAVVALVMVAANLRAALAAVSPVVPDLQATLGWDEAQTGALTTIPVLCMGLAAPLVPRLAASASVRAVVAAGLVLLAVGQAMRLAGAVPAVLLGSALLVGIGIAVAGGLLPGVVVDWFPARLGPATGAYTASMFGVASLAGAVTVPLMVALGSWQAALATWSLLAVAALAVWWPAASAGAPAPPVPVADAAAGARPVPRSRLPWGSAAAWAVTVYLAVNCFVFYALIAWLAPSYDDRGWEQADAGLLLAVFTLVQLVAALALPTLAGRRPGRRVAFGACVAVQMVGLLLVGLAPGTATVPVLVVLGLALGGGFALDLMLLSEYAVSAEASARFTAMAFLVAFCVGATGPLVVGALVDATGSWTPAYLLLAAACALQLAVTPLLRRGQRVR